jgi:hypothetical protein
MVENPGTTLHTDAIKLNTPREVNVKEDQAGFPVAIFSKGKKLIQTIDDSWRIDDEWWRTEPISRIYYAVILDTGQRIVIFKDNFEKRWYKQ